MYLKPLDGIGIGTDDGGDSGKGIKIKHKLSLPPFYFAVNELIIAKPGASYIYAGIKVVE
jgi:hypothetical protein